MSKKDCPICCSTFTIVLRKPVTCSYCHHEVCQDCVKKYILSSSSDPECMACHIPWTREFIDSIFSKAFRDTEYKKHREDILLDREKSFLPATIPFLESEVKKRELEKENRGLMEKKMELQKLIVELDQQLYRNDRTIRHQNNNVRGNGENIEEEKLDRRVFIKACVAQDCRGFLSSQWKCGVCSVKVCPNCHEVKEENHVCNPNNVETAKLLAKDTKPCPKCASSIFKVSGCDLMFCTICTVSFSWKSGREVTPANNHNPHYIDFSRRTNNGYVPRAPGDIPMTCGGFPKIRSLDRFIKTYNIHDLRLNNLLSLQRTLNHIYDYEILPNREDNILVINRDYRIRYLLNEISEEEWKRELQKREKKAEVKHSRRQVSEMLITVASDILNKLINFTTKSDINTTLNELETLLDYYNTSSQNIEKRFGIKSLRKFDANWVRH